MTIQTQNKTAIYSDKGEKYSGFSAIGIGKTGSGDGTSPGPGITNTFGTSELYTPKIVVKQFDPPGETLTKEFEYYAETNRQDFFLQAQREARQVSVQERIYDGVSLNNPRGWVKFIHWGLGDIGNVVLGSPLAREYSGAGVVNTATITFNIMFEFLRPKVSGSSVPTINVNCNDVTLVTDQIRSPFYPGPNKLAFAGLNAASGAAARVLSSSTKGGSWTAMADQPFGNDEHISSVVYKVLSTSQLMLVAGLGTTDAGARFSIAKVTLGFNDVVNGTFATVVSTQGATGQTVQAMGWRDALELLVASDGKVYVSKDFATSFGEALNPSASNAINRIFYTPDVTELVQYAYFCGASNTLFRKPVGEDTIQTLVGPEVSANLACGSVALNGVLYIGAGTKLYRSTDGGETAGSWSLVSTFDANVRGIINVGQDDQVLLVALTDGTVFVSTDSVIFEEIDTPDSGYNGMVGSLYDPNFALLFGTAAGGAPVISVLAP